MKYVPKPIPFEALKYNGTNKLEVLLFLGKKDEHGALINFPNLKLQSSIVKILTGDYVIKRDERFVVYDGKYFESIYEKEK